MAEHIVPLALVWLLLLGLLSQALHVTVPVAVRLWRAQVALVEARLRVLAEMPLLPEPSLRDLLRRASGRHRKCRLPRWLRIGVAS